MGEQNINAVTTPCCKESGVQETELDAKAADFAHSMQF
jgi:hypothetical protein